MSSLKKYRGENMLRLRFCMDHLDCKSQFEFSKKYV